MGIDLYYIPGSAPCRSVLLTAKAVGVELNLKMTNLMAGENRTPEYIKMNPQHTVPTLNDNGFVLWESRAICSYLVNKYGKEDTLYPKEAQARALVDQRLFFDIGTLYQRFGDYYYPAIFFGAAYDPEKMKKIEEAFKFLDTFLDGHTWVAGKNMTIADLALVATVSTYDLMAFDIKPYPNVAKWFNKVKETAPDYQEANGEGLIAFKGMVDALTKK